MTTIALIARRLERMAVAMPLSVSSKPSSPRSPAPWTNDHRPFLMRRPILRNEYLIFEINGLDVMVRSMKPVSYFLA